MITASQTHRIPVDSLKHSSKERFEFALAKLKEAGLRITRTRVALLSALSEHAHPVTVDQLHDHVGRKNCDLVTVYRCIATFEEFGLVQRCGFFPNGTVRYKMEASKERQYHIVCRTTNTLNDVDTDTSRELREAMAGIEDKLRAKGYTDLGHILEFFAVRESRVENLQIATDEWGNIARFYSEEGKDMRPLMAMVEWIVEQGLAERVYGSTSLFDLVISDKPPFRNAENMLRVSWDRVRGKLEFRFECYLPPGSSVTTIVPEEQSIDTLRDLLVTRFGINLTRSSADFIPDKATRIGG